VEAWTIQRAIAKAQPICVWNMDNSVRDGKWINGSIICIATRDQIFVYDISMAIATSNSS
jgi:hypothetical protein